MNTFFSVAVCLLLSFDDNKDAEGAIAVMRGLRGPGAVQSVKVCGSPPQSARDYLIIAGSSSGNNPV